MAHDDEKKVGTVTEAENISVHSNSTTSEDHALRRLATAQLDGAGQFLAANKDLDTSDVNVSKIRHKVDRTIIPLLCACYIM